MRRSTMAEILRLGLSGTRPCRVSNPSIVRSLARVSPLALICSILIACPPPAAAVDPPTVTDIDFIYPASTSANPSRSVSAWDGQKVLPLATLELTFSSVLDEAARSNFQSGFQLQHDLNIVAGNLFPGSTNPSGPHASFYWREEQVGGDTRSILRYRMRYSLWPYQGDSNWQITLPSGWSWNLPTDIPGISVDAQGLAHFTLKAFSGNLKVLHIVVKNKSDWEYITRRDLSNCCKDVPGEVVELRAGLYPDVSIGHRGQTEAAIRESAQPTYRLTFAKNKDDKFYRGFTEADADGVEHVIVTPSKRAPDAWLGPNMLRRVERALFGMPLATQAEACLLVLNGDFLGAYTCSPEWTTGKGGATASPDDGLEQNGFLDQAHPAGGRLENLNLNLIPTTAYKSTQNNPVEGPIVAMGDGVTTHFEKTMNYKIYVQWQANGGKRKGLDVVVEAKDSTGKRANEMVLIPNLGTLNQAEGSVELCGTINRQEIACGEEDGKDGDLKDGTGTITWLNSKQPHVRLNLARAPGVGEKVELESVTLDVAEVWNAAIGAAPPDKVYDTMFRWWLDLTSALNHMIYCRLAGDQGSVLGKHSYFTNLNNLDALPKPGDAAPASPYYRVILNVNDFQQELFGQSSQGQPLDESSDVVPLAWTLAKGSSEAAERYHQILETWVSEGLLRRDAYDSLLKDYDGKMGEGYEMDRRRWGGEGIDLQTERDRLLQNAGEALAAPLPDGAGAFIDNYVMELAVFIRGDANGDAQVNLADAVAILNYLFNNSPLAGSLDASDVDDSGQINLTDAVYLLNFLFAGGPPPLPPYPGMGADPTPDLLGP